MSAQLALNLRLRDSASFANFYAAGNAEALDCLRRAVGSLARGENSERVIYLWGPSGSGRTHLLQAACHHAQEARRTFAYIPFFEVADLAPTLLEGIESAPLVCLDDLQAVAGKSDWEEAIFAVAERLRARHQGLLVVAASAAPAHVGLGLPDLVTRLSWGPVFPLQTLNDDDKLEALQWRATRLGLELPLDVARYVLARHPRNMNSLFEWLDRADKQSLVAQRRLTIPFVRGLQKG